MFTHPFHVFDNHNAFLSEGGALGVVIRDFSETPHGTRNNKHFLRPMREREARLRLACPPPRSARRRAAREGCWWRGRPFLTAGAAPGGVAVSLHSSRLTRPIEGRSLHQRSLRTALVRTINHFVGTSYVALDDALPPIRSTVMKEIPLDLRGRQRTCIGAGLLIVDVNETACAGYRTPLIGQPILISVRLTLPEAAAKEPRHNRSEDREGDWPQAYADDGALCASGTGVGQGSGGPDRRQHRRGHSVAA